MSKSLANNATATTARQWQILSQLDRKRWLGTTHIKEQLDLMGFDISLRTIQRDLNALATRFPIEKKQHQSTRLALARRCTDAKLAAHEFVASGGV